MFEPASGDVEILIGSLESTRSTGTVFGRFEIRVDDSAFPSQGWSDFVLPVFLWIADALGRAKNEGAASAPFMDGQFTLRFEAEGDDVRAIGLTTRPRMSDRRILDARSSWYQWDCALETACNDILAKLAQLGLAEDSEAVAAILNVQHRLGVA